MTLAHLILRYTHISMGMVALLAGTGAMVFRKGSTLHKRSGNVFVISMLIMAAVGVWISVFITPILGNVMGGSLTIYMVATGWLAGWRRPGESGRLEIVGLLMGLTVIALGTSFGMLARAAPDGRLEHYPATFYFVFAGVAALGSLLDVRVIARGGLTAAARTTRHLWRMCVAMFIATGSFFLGQAKLFPAEWRGPMKIPVLLVIGALIYWLIRIRVWPLLRKIRPPRMAPRLTELR